MSPSPRLRPALERKVASAGHGQAPGAGQVGGRAQPRFLTCLEAWRQPEERHLPREMFKEA